MKYSKLSTQKRFYSSYKILVVVLLNQYCARDKIEKNKMGCACGAYG